MVERARALRGAGLTVMEITEILGGPGKTSVWRWIRDVRKPAGRAGGGMDLPRLVGDGPDYPDIDPEDKDALIERLRLENAVLRAVQDVLKAESLDGMSNREKTLVIDRLRPAGKWSLRELTGFLRISRSSYDYQRRAIARPDRLAPLRALVRRVFLEDGDGARGYRFVVRRLRELDDPVRVSEKVVRRIMREEGLVPRWMRRRAGAYSSYGGEVTPAPPNLVRRDFRSALPNFLWLTDITEFRLPTGRKVYLSAIRDCFDSSVVAWRAGERPDADLANSTLSDACSRLAPGELSRDPLRPRHALPLAGLDIDMRAERPGQEHVGQGLQPRQRRDGGVLRPAQEGVLPREGLVRLVARGVHRGPRRVDRALQLRAGKRRARGRDAGRLPVVAGDGRDLAVQEIVRSPEPPSGNCIPEFA